MRLSFSDANLTTEQEMKQRAVKYLCLLAVLLTLPVTATAQQRRGEDRRPGDRGSGERGTTDRGSRDRGDHDRNSKAAEKGVDQRRSGRPGFNPTLPSWEQKQAPWWERQGSPWWERGQTATPANTSRRTGNDHYRNRRNNGYGNGGVIYVVPGYPFFESTQTTTEVETPPPPAPIISRVPPPPPPVATGFLNLEVEPRQLLQVYVDAVYVGTPADLGDELRLTPGTRRIELRARGYKTLTFSAEIVADRSITYRGALERDAASPEAPSEPVTVRPATMSGPTTMYMIQGCYLGNIAPRASDLRSGCDISRMITFKP